MFSQELFNNIYIYNFLVMAFSLPLFIGFVKKKVKKGFFFKFTELTFELSTFVYIGSVFFIQYSGFKELGIIVAKDIGIISAIAIISALINKNAFLTLITVALIGAGTKFYYFDILMNKFAKQILLSENGEILLDIKDHKLRSKLDSVLNKYNIKTKLAFRNIKHEKFSDLDDYYVLDIPEEHLDKIDEIIKELEKTGAVDYTEKNEVINIKPVKGKEKNLDDLKEYRMNDPRLKQLWAFNVMEVDKVYNFINKNDIKPKKQVLIAILDTGVDSKHEDLKENYFSINKDYDFDTDRHGTHCAGIAGAVTNNGIGIASIFPDNNFINITSITVLPRGRGSDELVISGIIEASDNGADIISMSLGGESFPEKQRAYEEAIKYANKSGAIVVVAAGNESQNAINASPANVDGVITVTAVDDNLNKAYFSNTIEDIKMGIAAPGVNIFSTVPNNNYESLNGTSMATPYVASILALMKSLKPEITTKEAYDILVKTGRQTNNTRQTGMLVQPYRVIQYMLKNK